MCGRFVLSDKKVIKDKIGTVMGYAKEMLGPIAKILAWLGLAYGAWKLWQGFKN